MAMLIAIGPGFGSDAGYWYIGADGKLHRVVGWGERAMLEVNAAVAVLAAASGLKDGAKVGQIAGLAQTLLAPNMEYIQNVGKAAA